MRTGDSVLDDGGDREVASSEAFGSRFLLSPRGLDPEAECGDAYSCCKGLGDVGA